MKAPFSFALIWVVALSIESMLPTKAASEPQTRTNLQNVDSQRQPVTIQYFLDQPINGYDGHENRNLGDLRICVNILRSGGREYVSLWNVMTFVDRWLIIKSVQMKKLPSGKFDFAFTDNWENEGTGSIEYLGGDRIKLDIKSTRPSEGPPNRNILGQYGTSVLSKGACPHVRFLEGAGFDR